MGDIKLIKNVFCGGCIKHKITTEVVNKYGSVVKEEKIVRDYNHQKIIDKIKNVIKEYGGGFMIFVNKLI